jgi:hypothetical protein
MKTWHVQGILMTDEAHEIPICQDVVADSRIEAVRLACGDSGVFVGDMTDPDLDEDFLEFECFPIPESIVMERNGFAMLPGFERISG